MKFSLCIDAVLKEEADFYDRLQIAKELGYDAVEFWEPANKDIDKLARLSAQHNIPVAACCLKNAWDNLYRMSEDPARVKKNVEESCKLAKDMGCKTLIGLSGDMKYRGYDESDVLIANLSRCAEVLEKEGVTLVLEALNSIVNHKGYFLDSAYTGFNIMKAVGSSNCRLLYDVYHMQIMEGNLVQTVGNNINWIGHFHLAGVPGRKEIMDCEINYPKVLRTAEEAGYDRYYGLEYWTSYNTMQSLKDTIDYLRKI